MLTWAHQPSGCALRRLAPLRAGARWQPAGRAPGRGLLRFAARRPISASWAAGIRRPASAAPAPAQGSRPLPTAGTPNQPPITRLPSRPPPRSPLRLPAFAPPTCPHSTAVPATRISASSAGKAAVTRCLRSRVMAGPLAASAHCAGPDAAVPFGTATFLLGMQRTESSRGLHSRCCRKDYPEPHVARRLGEQRRRLRLLILNKMNMKNWEKSFSVNDKIEAPT
ncbi:MAG: hypothetical protein WKG07_38375 [Hymenobacter sp.]